MKKIKLFNRDGANLWIEELKNGQWELKVDKKHDYCLKYIRCIGDYPDNIEAVDPSGGPMINIGNIFEDKYKIIKIIDPTHFLISEYGNN